MVLVPVRVWNKQDEAIKQARLKYDKPISFTLKIMLIAELTRKVALVYDLQRKMNHDLPHLYK